MSSDTDTESIRVIVRFWAAARAAAGVDEQVVALPVGASLADLDNRLRAGGHALAAVLSRSSFLRDGVAVRDRGLTLAPGQLIDVLPPFAGG